MQQKAQLIATLVHNPDLVIIDKPFSALDPVNTQMVKDLLREDRENGKTIVMCTHQMHQVEELCDRLILIDQGRVVLYGNLGEIQREYAGQEVIVRAQTPLPDSIVGVDQITALNGHTRLRLSANTTPQRLLYTLVAMGIPLEQFEVAMPTLDEIFIRVVTQDEAQA
jgi:ABC-2 type transport system ATP-binding protein